MSDRPDDFPHDDLYGMLLDACVEEGPLMLDLLSCRQCGNTEFAIVPMRRGTFEGTECPECGMPGLDQVEVDP